MTPLKIAALLLTLAVPASAQNVVITGNNGGTMQKNRDCARGDGTANCSASTTATGANGNTYTKDRQRTTQAGSSTSSVTRTGPSGEAKTRTRSVFVTR